MNYNLKNASLSRLCVIDIETVRGKKTITTDDPEFSLIREKFKNKDTLEYLPDEEVIAKYLRYAPLNANFGKIVCISLAVFDVPNNMIVTTSFFEGKEYDIIESVVNMIRDNKLLLAGHNIIGFDMPYIRKRYHALGAHYKKEYYGAVNDSGAKPWDLEKVMFDTMAIEKGTAYENSSIAELCFVYGLSNPKDSVKASQVSELYYKGEISKIAEYCEGDVAAVANLILIWLAMEPWNVLSRTFDTVKGPYQGDETRQAEEGEFTQSTNEDSPLQKLVYAEEIDQELEDEIIEFLGEVCPEDVDSLRAILTGLYMPIKPLKAVREARELEIEEIINNLNIVECQK
ncbi:MAG: 3'-5' exonuclease [Flavobacterium sp.]